MQVLYLHLLWGNVGCRSKSGKILVTVGILVAAIAVSTIFLMWKFTAGKESEEEVIETENINVRGFLKKHSQSDEN